MSASYQLFLDDERDVCNVTWIELPLGPWVIVRSYAEFVAHITKHGIPEFVSFDHDLSLEHYRVSMYAADKHYSNYYADGTFKEKTGRCCAQWLVEYCLENNIAIPDYTVHSMNTIGKENIIAVMESGKRVQGEIITP